MRPLPPTCSPDGHRNRPRTCSSRLLLSPSSPQIPVSPMVLPGLPSSLGPDLPVLHNGGETGSPFCSSILSHGTCYLFQESGWGWEAAGELRLCEGQGRGYTPMATEHSTLPAR